VQIRLEPLTASAKSWTGKLSRSMRQRGLVGTVRYGAALIAYSIRSHFPAGSVCEHHLGIKVVSGASDVD